MKEEIKHFKSLLRQGSLRHMNILLDDNFQKELLTIIKNYEKLQHENKQLKEQLLVTQTNEETFRLEMEDITQTLGLDEDTLFDDVKVYVRSLKDNWNELKKYIQDICCYDEVGLRIIDPSYLEDKIAELERGVSNE